MILSTRPSALNIKGAFGVALNLQVLSSIYLGPDEFGHDRFESTRSEIGEAVYRLKYRGDKSKALDLAETAWDFIRRRPTTAALINVIITAPPSNLHRPFQPIDLVADELSRLSGIPRSVDVLAKIKETTQLKNVTSSDEKFSLLHDAFAIQDESLIGQNVLLLDDLYDSGATTQCIVDTLIKQAQIASIRVLALSRTRKRK